MDNWFEDNSEKKNDDHMILYWRLIKINNSGSEWKKFRKISSDANLVC